MNDAKFYIGPMSKNVVDSVIEFVEETGSKIGFIPSRRQVEFDGGYVNNWTTKEFSEYVNGRVPIERDHGGPGQGYKYDEGLRSFMIDVYYLDIIHIDPWKVYPKHEDGLEFTVDSIKKLYDMNSKMLFEVGTEESIRGFSSLDLERLLAGLEAALSPEMFSNIKYAVVQSGVGLDLGKRANTGKFDPSKLSNMIETCKKFGILSKEHNGDYLTNEQIKMRFQRGLDSINIAPQFGQIETNCYLDAMGDEIENFYRICYNSRRWEKWVSGDFIPIDNKRELIEICGHYVLSNKEFLEIAPPIDGEIREKIKLKLKDLCGIIK